jgi:hypothetical protein
METKPMPETTVGQLIEYVWIPIVLSVVGLWRKFSGAETRVQLLELSKEHHAEQRLEERELRDSQHGLVMKKLDSMEIRIKNGH